MATSGGTTTVCWRTWGWVCPGAASAGPGRSVWASVIVGHILRARTDRGRHEQAQAQPGGQVSGRPPMTCRWAWKTLCCAAAPVFATMR